MKKEEVSSTTLENNSNGRKEFPQLKLPLIVCLILASILMFANYLPIILINAMKFLGPMVKSHIAIEVGLGMITFLLVLCTCLLFLKIASKKSLDASLKDIGWTFTKYSLRNFLLGWLFVSIAMILAQFITSAIGQNDRLMHPFDNSSPINILVGALSGFGAGVLMQGMPEELIWRGWIMNCMKNKPIKSLLISCIAFGLLHIVSQGGQENILERIVYLIDAAAFAFLAGALSLRFKSLWLAFGVHGGYHLTNMILSSTPFRSEAPIIWILQSITWISMALIVLKGFKGDKVEYLY